MVRLPTLRRYRELAALTQQELAARSGVSRETIIRLEAGHDGFVTTARRLARALRVAPAALMVEREEQR